MRRLVLVCVLVTAAACFLKSGPARAQDSPGESIMTTVEIMHRTADEIAAILLEFRSDGAIIRVDSRSNKIVIREQPAVLDQMMELIAELDQPSELQGLSFEIEVYLADAQEPTTDERVISEDKLKLLRSTFSFKHYHLLSNSSLTGTENNNVELATVDHQIYFRPMLKTSESGKQLLELQRFHINQTVKQSTFKFDSTITLEPGKRMIIGGSSVHSANNAVMIAIQANLK